MVVGNRVMAQKSESRKARVLSWGGTALGILLLIAALVFFWRVLQRYDMAEVMEGFRRIPAHRLALALLCVALSYLTQTGYDFVGARSVGLGIGPSKAMLAAFIGNSFTNNIGFSLLTGTSLRYRFYSAWGFSTLDIAQVIALSKLAFFNGLFVFAGLAQLIVPAHLPDSIHLPLPARLLGFLILVPPAALILLNGVSRGDTLKVGKIILNRPRQSLFLLQIAISCLHMAFAAGTLYFLLPAADLSAAGYAGPIAFLGSYMAIKFVVMFVPVPGSLGVFEGTAVAVLTPALPAHPVLGALLAYRLAYCVLPFALALCLLVGFESASRQGLLASLTRRRRAGKPA